MPVNRKLRVFLCHASQDKSSVRELYNHFLAEGWIDPWLDEGKLLPGQDWRTAIEEAVESSDVVIICLSKNSVNKEGFVQKELRYAREISLEKPDGTIFLIPLRLDECDVPRGLRFIQWTDYFGKKKEQSYKGLLEALNARYRQLVNQKPLERTQAKEQRTANNVRQVRKEILKPSATKIIVLLGAVFAFFVIAVLGFWGVTKMIQPILNTSGNESPMVLTQPPITATLTDLPASDITFPTISNMPEKVELLKTLQGSTQAISAMTFSPDGKILVVCSSDGIRLWDISSGKILFWYMQNGLYDIAYSPDGKIIAGAGTNQLSFWNISDQFEFSFLEGFKSEDFFSSITFSPDGKFLAATSVDQNSLIVFTAPHPSIAYKSTDLAALVTFGAYSPDGKKYVLSTAGTDPGIFIFNTEPWEVIKKVRCSGEACPPVEAINFTPSGQMIVRAATRITVYADVGETPLYTIHNPYYVPGQNGNLLVSPDGKVFIVPGEDAIRIWNVSDGSLVRELKERYLQADSVAISSDNTTLVIGTGDGKIQIWGIPPGN